jgi:hypothetical protein
VIRPVAHQDHLGLRRAEDASYVDGGRFAGVGDIKEDHYGTAAVRGIALSPGEPEAGGPELDQS